MVFTDEPEYDLGPLKRLGALAIVMIILGLLHTIPFGSPLERDPTYQPSHTISIWLPPHNDSFTLHIDFYEQESDAYDEHNRLCGTGHVIDQDMTEIEDSVLYAIPRMLNALWVVAYVEEDVRAVHEIRVGHRTTIPMIPYTFDVLIELWEDNSEN